MLQEQIRSSGQNEEHYKERLESLQKSLNEAKEEKAGYQEKQDAFDEKLAGIRREQEQLQEILAQTSSQIAEFLGYYNYSYFSRLFKKRVGVSPNEYRTRMMRK